MQKNSTENLYISALHSIGLSHKELKILILEKNFLPQEIFEEIQKYSKRITIFLSENRLQKIYAKIKNFDIQKHFQYIEGKHIYIYSLLDSNFPEKIRYIHQTPFLIYTLGNIQLQKISIGIVGSRKNTEYGKRALQSIVDDIPLKNISIISGGAYGIDSLAHEIAIRKGFHTIAVFGCGIDIIYPKTNTTLFSQILDSGGGLVSSFPIGSQPETYNFPIRNEIVAGFSDNILIPEAGLKSGTLITARLALELGKDVFAIPGDIFRETSQGCNLLINQSEAYCAISAKDLFPDYQPTIPQTIAENIEKLPKKKSFSSENAEKIYYSIQSGNNVTDSILQDTKLPIETVSIELTMLELSGDISSIRPGFYEITF